MDTMIPRRIIQIWGGGQDLPLLARAAAANLRLLHPEFEYLLFDDDRMASFVGDEFPQYRHVFKTFPLPVQRYDFFRYLAVYRLGGFYFDFDVFLANSIEALLSSRCVFPFEALTINRFLRRAYGMDWEVGTYAFGSLAGHPFLRAIIDNCVKAQVDGAWTEPMMRSVPRIFREEFQVLYTTGPGLVSRTLAEHPGAAKEVKVLFPSNVCDTEYWDRFGEYGVHLRKGGWRKHQSFLRRRLIARWMLHAEKKALRESRRRGGLRSLQFTRHPWTGIHSSRTV